MLQRTWDEVVLATPDSLRTKKRFLSRSARYSGLQNILQYVDVKDDDEQLKNALLGSNAWIAFNVSRESIPKFSNVALEAGVKRAIFTVELEDATLAIEDNIAIPGFVEAASAFAAVGGAFTGIRHGKVVPGGEDFPYDITNASLPCYNNTIERGVLARVTSELLFIPQSANTHCGLASSHEFAAAYLDVVRSAGVTRRQEVEKVFGGAIMRLGESYMEGRLAAAREFRKKEQERLKGVSPQMISFFIYTPSNCNCLYTDSDRTSCVLRS